MAGVIRAVSILCLVLALAIAPSAITQIRSIEAASPTAPTGLRVAGARLVDGHGDAVVLHGVDISGTEFACAQGGTPGHRGWSIFGGQPEDTPATIAAIQSWHVNAVRVPLNEDCWLGLNGIDPAFGGQSYRSAIGKFVTDLVEAGKYVNVDLHWNAPGDAIALSQQPMADADHASAFWSSVARFFAGNTNVLFDLYNEPFLYGTYFAMAHQDAWSCWLNGCSLNQFLTGGHPYTQRYGWQTAGMQQLVNTVRSAGASNVLIANGLNWANDDSGWMAHQPNDPLANLVAGWHEYEGEQCAAVACWSQTIAPIARKVPVIVGETGDNAGSGCHLANLPALVQWADSHAVSYVAWTFNPWGYTHDVLITDWKGTPSACEGRYYADHLAVLAANPGLVASQPAPDQSAVASDANGVLRVVYIVMLLFGVAILAYGLALATNIKAWQRGFPFSKMHSRRRHVPGVAIVACGAIVCLFAILLIYKSQFSMR